MIHGATLAAELARELARQLPGDFTGRVRAHVQAGRVQRPLHVERADGLRREGGWPAPGFSRDLVAWLQLRVDRELWGSVEVVVEGGRATSVVLAERYVFPREGR